MLAKKSLLVMSGAVGCVLVLLCVGVAALAGFVYYTNVSGMASVDRIAYVDNGLNIQVVDAQGEHRVAITSDATNSQQLYMFPTWSPNSQSLAFVGLMGDRQNHVASLKVARATGGNLTTVFESKTQIPFYLYWAPDNQRIGFLAQDENDMALMVGRMDGKEEAKRLDTGSALYWSWSPDSQRLLTHVGGSAPDSKDRHLALIPAQGSSNPQALTDTPGAFQAPQYSPDGSTILYAKDNGTDTSDLYAADARGGNSRSILSFTGRIAFAWSPDGKRIATLVTPVDGELPTFGPVAVGDAEGKNWKELVKGPALAFYWAPNGKQLAVLTIGDQDKNPTSGCRDCGGVGGLAVPAPADPQIQLTWNVVNVESGDVRKLATFAPTDGFIAVLPFFDQYARSMTFWSPDSRHFVYTQMENETDGSVWVVDVDALQPRRIGDGTLAVWSWK